MLALETQLLIYGLSHLTQRVGILAKFQIFGRIEKLDMLADPNSGASLGLWHLKFKGTPEEAHEAAKRAVKQASNLNIDSKTPRICFDDSGRRSRKLMADIIARKALDTAPKIDNIPKGPRMEQERIDHARSRSKSPPSRHIERFLSLPVVYQRYSSNFPPISIPKIMKIFSKSNYDSIYQDSYGIYAVYPTRRDAYRCFDRLHRTRVLGGSYKMDLAIYDHGLKRRDDSMRRIDRPEEYPRPSDRDRRIIDDRRYEGDHTRSQKDIYLSRDPGRRGHGLDSGYDKHLGDPRIDRLDDKINEKLNKIKPSEQRPQFAPSNPHNAKSEATSYIVSELKSMLINDIRERVTVPTLYEFLHPNRFKHIVEQEKQEAKKAEQEKYAAEISITEDKPNSLFSNAIKSDQLPSIPRIRKRQSQEHSQSIPKTRTAKPKFVARPLHHRLNYSSSDDDSDSSSPDSTPALSTSEPSSRAETNDKANGKRSGTTKPAKRRLRHLDYTSSEDEDEDDLAQVPLKRNRVHRTPDSSPITTPLDTPQKRRAFDNLIDDSIEAIRKKESKKTLKKVKKEFSSPSKKIKLENSKVLIKDELKSSRPHIAFEINQSDEEDEIEEIKLPKDSKLWRPMNHAMNHRVIHPEFNWDYSEEKAEPVVDDPFEPVLDLDGYQSLIKDSEDFQLIKHVLATTKPKSIKYLEFDAWNRKDIKSINNGGQFGPTPVPIDVGEKLRWMSKTGASRSDGYLKILEADKAAYLPHRKKIHKPIDTLQYENSNKEHNTTTYNSRTNRINNRRLQADISMSKQMLSTETDILRFNQLKKRRKPVKFARSAIHNWGLYAIEPIAANEMIIEYVGEIIRQKVAERREKNYLRSGIGSSYLFRIDETTVIDATKQGGIARFINHCCTPSCTAKIIKVEGQKRIVIYALRDIAADEELTYDYKFEKEENGEERIPCLCGAPGCKGFLN